MAQVVRRAAHSDRGPSASRRGGEWSTGAASTLRRERGPPPRQSFDRCPGTRVVVTPINEARSLDQGSGPADGAVRAPRARARPRSRCARRTARQRSADVELRLRVDGDTLIPARSPRPRRRVLAHAPGSVGHAEQRAHARGLASAKARRSIPASRPGRAARARRRGCARGRADVVRACRKRSGAPSVAAPRRGGRPVSWACLGDDAKEHAPSCRPRG